MMIQRPKYTRDFPPEVMAARREVENRMRQVVLSYGYNEVATPTIEHLELFVKKSGDDIVKQLYNFKDKGGRDITLRPELTAPVMRFYYADLRMRPKPLKVFYFGNCFRYERGQEGRYREFFQFGVEMVGGDISLGNAELVDLASACLSASGLSGFVIRVGHLGVLGSVLEKAGLNDAQRKYCMPLIDKGEFDGLEQYLVGQGFNESDISLIQNVVQYKVDLTFFRQNVAALEGMLSGNQAALDSLQELKTIGNHIISLGTQGIQIDLGIARGLDYYTHLVFEADLLDLGAQKQICGGGHYSLGELFDVTDEPNATGFAIGFDRVMLGLEKQDYQFEKPYLDAYVVPLEEKHLDRALKIVSDLRAEGFRTDIDQNIRGMGKALKYAQGQSARFTVFVGLEEVAEGNVGLKNMETREQVDVGINDLSTRLRA